MHGFQLAFVMLAFLLSSSAIHAQPIAQCAGARVAVKPDMRHISVNIGKETLVGRIDYFARGKYSRIINVSCVSRSGDKEASDSSCDLSRMTIALIDEEPRGLLVITSKGKTWDDWFYFPGGEQCPGPSVISDQQFINRVPTCSQIDVAKIAAESDLASGSGSSVWIASLGADEAKTFCEENRKNSAYRAKMAQAVADFMAHRKKYKSSSREDELESTPQLAMELYKKCYHIRHLGVYMHGSGLMLFPQFASAGCYASLLPVFDPAK